MWEFLDNLIPDINGLLVDCLLTHDDHGQTCLHYLAMGGQTALVIRLLHLIDCAGTSPSCIDQEDKSGRTAFWYSAANAHWPLAALLLTYGANPSVKNPWPGVFCGCVEVRTPDTKNHCMIDLPRMLTVGLLANAASCSILHAACAMGEVSLVKMLCNERSQLATTVDNDGRSALFYAAYNGRKDVIDVLFSLDVDWLSIDDAVFVAVALHTLKQARHIGLITTPKHGSSTQENASLFMQDITDQMAYTTGILAIKEPLFAGESGEANLSNADDCIVTLLERLGGVETLSTQENHLLTLAAVVIGSHRIYTLLQNAMSLMGLLLKDQIVTAMTTSIGLWQHTHSGDDVSLFELALHFLKRRIIAQSRYRTLNHEMSRETITLLISADDGNSALLATTTSPLLSPVMRTVLEMDSEGILSCDAQSYLHIYLFALKNAPDCATLLANAIHERPESDARDALAVLALQKAVYYKAGAAVQAMLKLGQNPGMPLKANNDVQWLAGECLMTQYRPSWSALHVAVARGHGSLFATLWKVATRFSSPSVNTGSDLWNELLYMSAAYGNDEVRACLTQKGCPYMALSCDVDGVLSRKIDTRSVCLTAAKNGHGRYAETVFGDKASHGTALCDEDGQTNLYHYAARNGLLTLTTSLLHHDVPGFNRTNEHGVTPIRSAQAFGHTETLRVLLEHAKAAGITTTVCRWRPHGVLRFMEQHKVSVDRSLSLVRKAELKKDASSFKSVAVRRVAHTLAQQRDHMAWVYIQAVQPALVQKNAKSQTLLHYAAAAGCTNSLTLLLDMAKQQKALKVCIMEDSVGRTGIVGRVCVRACVRACVRECVCE